MVNTSPASSLPPAEPSEDKIDPRAWRERHFSLWAFQLLMAGMIVWLVVSGMRAVQRRYAKQQERRRMGKVACGMPLRVPEGKGAFRLLVLELSRKHARWNTQEGLRPDERKGVARWVASRLGPDIPASLSIRASSVWTLHAQPPSVREQQQLAEILIGRCKVDAVASVVLTKWPGQRSPSAKNEQDADPPSLPSGWEMSRPLPPGYAMRGLWMLSRQRQTISWKPADRKVPLTLARAPHITIRSLPTSSSQLAHEAFREPFALLQGWSWALRIQKARALTPLMKHALQRRICRPLQQGKAALKQPCHLALQKAPQHKRPSSPQITIPAGDFWFRAQKKAEMRSTPAFAIDRDEVTRGDYARCVLAGQCPLIDGTFDGGWALPRDRLKVDAAKQYCAWHGRQLPTEEQWVKAARGALKIQDKPNSTPKRAYPWGDTKPTCKQANVHWCFQVQRNRVKIPTLLPVSQALEDRSPYGVLSMAGNAAEMMQDGLIKGGTGFSPPHPIDWRGRIELRRGLSWVGFRCVSTKTP